MKIVQLNDDEIYRHLNQPFNPPTLDDEGYDEKDFSSEWHQVNGQLRKLLDRHGEFDDYGEKDFLLGDTLTLSRGVSAKTRRRVQAGLAGRNKAEGTTVSINPVATS